MDVIRILLSTLSFFLGGYLLFDLIFSGFDIYVLLGSILAFILANYLWPQKRKEDSALQDSLDLIDLLEIFIRFPFRAIAYVLRGLGKIGREANDIDLP